MDHFAADYGQQLFSCPIGFSQKLFWDLPKLRDLFWQEILAKCACRKICLNGNQTIFSLDSFCKPLEMD